MEEYVTPLLLMWLAVMIFAFAAGNDGPGHFEPVPVCAPNNFGAAYYAHAGDNDTAAEIIRLLGNAGWSKITRVEHFSYDEISAVCEA